MRATGTNETSLVIAAQAGDRHALDALVATSLPLVYTIVRRALSGHPDADDVVQDTLLRAVRRLPALHTPESFRPWLAAIAVHQVSTYLRRRVAAARRATTLDEAAELPDADAGFEDLTILRLELSRQRRQVVRAGRWLDPDDRVLLALWWLETAGELTRTELAAALGVGAAHAGVRVQRMRHQLELSREVVAALDARPRCAALEAVVAHWDGTPNPLWRKRIARHTRSCGVCGSAARGMIAAERLLVGLALLPVPAGLAAALLGKTAFTATSTAALVGATGAGASGGVGASVKAGLFGQFIQAVVAHPVAAVLAAGALTAGAAVTVTTLPTPVPLSSVPLSSVPLAVPQPSAPAVRAAPSSAPASTTPVPKPPTATAAGPRVTRPESLAPGRPVSLESADRPGLFVTTADGLGVLAPVGSSSTDATRRRATFAVTAGLADPDCFSFRAPNGWYLRHAYWRLRLNPNVGTQLFRADATFCVRPGATADSVALESSNYPGWFLRHRGDELWVDHSDGSAAFRAESSFRTWSALAG
jgi:RNA polymerase sigma factor (sigma-70 family)